MSIVATYADVTKYRQVIPNNIYNGIRYCEPVVFREGSKKEYFIVIVAEDSLLFVKMREYSATKRRYQPFLLKHVVSVEKHDDPDRDLFEEEELSEQCELFLVDVVQGSERITFHFTTFTARSTLFFHVQMAWFTYMFRYTLGISIKIHEIADKGEARLLYQNFEKEYQCMPEENLIDKTELLKELSYLCLQDRNIKEYFFNLLTHRAPGTVALVLVLIDEPNIT